MMHQPVVYWEEIIDDIFAYICVGLLLLGCFIGGIWMIVHTINSRRKVTQA